MVSRERERSLREVESNNACSAALRVEPERLSEVNRGRRGEIAVKGMPIPMDAVKDRTKGRQAGSRGDWSPQSSLMDSVVIDKTETVGWAEGAENMTDEDRVSFLNFLNCPVT